MKFDIREKVKERNILLAAHRGVNGGNIPCNSLQCYRIAQLWGADIIEVDVTASKDGELFMLHPGMEKVHFREDINIANVHSSEVKKIFLANQDLTKTQYPVVTFDEMLEELKGKCFINVDKFWNNPKSISERIRAHGMTDQILVKTGADKATLDKVEKYAYDMQYMTVTRGGTEVHEEIKRRNINYIGSEVLFDNDDCEVCSDEYIEKLHKDNLIVWANAIVYNYKDVIASNHTDDVSVLGNPDDGWGWLAKKKFDIIQTDWLTQCDAYLKEKGYRR